MYSKSLSIGPFTTEIKTDVASVASMLERMYADFSPPSEESFIDFPVFIRSADGLRKWLYPQVEFFCDTFKPFKPLPRKQAYPMLEWGLNWCIANYAHQYLILHASVLVKNDKAIIFPAHQGSGKSTLSAGLMLRGWRLFSDELALIDMQSMQVQQCTRPINLKNDAIELIASESSQVCFSDVSNDTHKGSVALLKPSTESLSGKPQASIGAFAFVKYQPGVKGSLNQVTASDAFSRIIDNSFNYHVQMHQGFEVVHQLASRLKAFDFPYSNFDDADALLSELLCQN
ncbi:HprK-related kinase A [Thalassotalea maritima]|uniref:HprK-related kinase A n=1 Tax=Thalassotalea maritima TaxID=3242416 RepID=UPI003529B3C2